MSSYYGSRHNAKSFQYSEEINSNKKFDFLKREARFKTFIDPLRCNFTQNCIADSGINSLRKSKDWTLV
jgi:hypothetical protein